MSVHQGSAFSPPSQNVEKHVIESRLNRVVIVLTNERRVDAGQANSTRTAGIFQRLERDRSAWLHPVVARRHNANLGASVRLYIEHGWSRVSHESMLAAGRWRNVRRQVELIN